MRKDKEATKAYGRKYYKEHREVILQRAKDFYYKVKEGSNIVKKVVVCLFLLLPLTSYAETDIQIYEKYVDMCMNNDPSDFIYCQCMGRCMVEKTDETARKYFERDWFFGVCGTECDRWYNSAKND